VSVRILKAQGFNFLLILVFFIFLDKNAKRILFGTVMQPFYWIVGVYGLRNFVLCEFLYVNRFFVVILGQGGCFFVLEEYFTGRRGF
jgi:hypothetical protein